MAVCETKHPGTMLSCFSSPPTLGKPSLASQFLHVSCGLQSAMFTLYSPFVVSWLLSVDISCRSYWWSYLGALLFLVCDTVLLIGQKGDAVSLDLPCWTELQNLALSFSGITWNEIQSSFSHQRLVQCISPVGKRLTGMKSSRIVQECVSFYG